MTDNDEIAEVLARRLKEADIGQALGDIRRHAQDERTARERKERAVSAARDLGATDDDIEGALQE